MSFLRNLQGGLFFAVRLELLFKFIRVAVDAWGRRKLLWLPHLVLMPIKPHDELHHKVMDPQVAQMQTGDSKKVLIPWTDDMVYVDPERKKAQPQKAVLIANAAARAGR